MKKTPIFLALLLVSLLSFPQKKKPKSVDTLPVPLYWPEPITTIWSDGLRSAQPTFISALMPSFDSVTFEAWPGKGVSINADTLTITGNKITHILMNGELYIVTPGDIDIRSAFDPAGARKLIDSIYAAPTIILRVRRW